MNADPVLKIWLVWLANRILGVVGPGLASLGITVSNETPALMAGIVLTAMHWVIAYYNTQAALRRPTSPAQMVNSTPNPKG